jgi:Tfp pilus assembly protein PilO
MAAVIVAALMIWLVFLPQRAELANISAQRDQTLQAVKVIETFSNAHPNMDDFMARLKGEETLARQMLPGSPAIEDYLLQLETTAKASGVTLVAVTPSAATDKGTYQETQLEIITKGNFFQTVEFVKQLNNGPRFTTIINISIHAEREVLESKLVLKIYNTKS